MSSGLLGAARGPSTKEPTPSRGPPREGSWPLCCRRAAAVLPPCYRRASGYRPGPTAHRSHPPSRLMDHGTFFRPGPTFHGEFVMLRAWAGRCQARGLAGLAGGRRGWLLITTVVRSGLFRSDLWCGSTVWVALCCLHAGLSSGLGWHGAPRPRSSPRRPGSSAKQRQATPSRPFSSFTCPEVLDWR